MRIFYRALFIKTNGQRVLLGDNKLAILVANSFNFTLLGASFNLREQKIKVAVGADTLDRVQGASCRGHQVNHCVMEAR